MWTFRTRGKQIEKRQNENFSRVIFQQKRKKHKNILFYWVPSDFVVKRTNKKTVNWLGDKSNREKNVNSENLKIELFFGDKFGNKNKINSKWQTVYIKIYTRKKEEKRFFIGPRRIHQLLLLFVRKCEIKFTNWNL